MSNFENKVALVTGAAAGIGRATALRFAKEGAKVAVCDVDAPGGEDTVAQIRRAGGQAIFIRADVSRGEEVDVLVSRTIRELGGLDYAFNNAGIEGQASSTIECSEANWDRVIAVNLKSVWLCMRRELAHMVSAKQGVIVNCASIAGLVGFPGVPAYVASKHGIVGLTRTAALEFARSGVRVNAVCPGVIKTAMIDRFTHGEAQALAVMAQGEPVGRLGTPEEIAGTVLWLCSPDASFVTGQAIAVDGGWVAQ